MQIAGVGALVTGGASGLGLATAEQLCAAGAEVTIVDLASSDGDAVAAKLGGSTRFFAADVRSGEEMAAAVAASARSTPLRVLVHCAGRGGTVRVVDKDGTPGSLEAFEDVVRLNLVGSFNVLRLAAAAMAGNDPLDGDRGVCVLTASVAAFEGQVGQLPYSASKAGVVGMTLTAARDLASRMIRVCTIAPGTFETPLLLSRLSEQVLASLGAAVPHPRRLGRPDEFAKLALHIIDNGMLNGETLRLDGAMRMPPR